MRNSKLRNNKKQQKSGKPADAEDGVGQYPAVCFASMDLVRWQNPRVRDPMPQRYRSVFTYAFDGLVAAGTGTSLYYVRGNSLYLPGQSGGWTNTSPAIGTTNATGYSRLVNVTSYQSWRVFGSRIEVVFAPQAQVDTINASVTPSFIATQPTTVQLALGQQFCRAKVIVEGQPQRSQTIVNKMTTHRLQGVPKLAVELDLSGQNNGLVASYPSNLWYWVVNFDTANQANLVNNLPFRVTVWYDAECFGDSTADNPITPLAESPSTSEVLFRKYLAAKASEKGLDLKQ